MSNTIKTTLVIIGALIGAGFASGQEIYLFFFSYGLEGAIGIIISTTLLGIVIYKALKIIIDQDIHNYQEFLEYIVPSKTNNKIKIKIIQIINIIINLFILITFFIMIAGFGAYLKQSLGIPQIIGSSILAILSLLILSKETKGIIKVNEGLVPILILFIITIGICNSKNINFLNIQNYITKVNHTNWLVSGILYTSYNSILLIPVLISIKKIIKPKQISKISILVMILTTILALSVFIGMIKIDVDISKLEMPISYVVANQFSYLKGIYGIVILASILTTAISLGAGFLQDVAKTEKARKNWLIAICIISIPVSQIGFANLINLLYPVFGYLGLGIIFCYVPKIRLPKGQEKFE